MKFGKKTVAMSMAVSLALVLGACGADKDEAKEEPKQEETKTDTAGKTEEKPAAETPAISGLVAGGALKDGEYSLSEKEISDKGWKTEFKITVKDGKITESNYNYVNAEGKLKTDDEEYQKNMSEKTGVGPKEYIPALNADLVAKQNAGDVEVVTGATHSAESFINYAQQLIQAAQKGDTTPIIIDAAAPLKDGDYSLTEKNIGSTGWKVVFKMTVKDGKIATSDYNYVNADGKLKTDDEEYQKTMKEKSGTGPQEYIPALNSDLVAKQNAGEVAVVTGATHSAHGFKMYAAQLINAAQNGDTTPIEVDNLVFEKK